MDFEHIPEKSELFDDWNKKKQKLDSTKRKLLFKEGEIWWCSLGINVGEEVYGKGPNFSRPVTKEEFRKIKKSLTFLLGLS